MLGNIFMFLLAGGCWATTPSDLSSSDSSRHWTTFKRIWCRYPYLFDRTGEARLNFLLVLTDIFKHSLLRSWVTGPLPGRTGKVISTHSKCHWWPGTGEQYPNITTLHFTVHPYNTYLCCAGIRRRPLSDILFGVRLHISVFSPRTNYSPLISILYETLRLFPLVRLRIL